MFHQDQKWLNEIIFSLRARYAADNQRGWILQPGAHFALGCVFALRAHSCAAKYFLRAGAHCGAKARGSLRFCAAPHLALCWLPNLALISTVDSAIRTMTTPETASYSC
jgi:hypothetical protein